jgi:hypothetical protein
VDATGLERRLFNMAHDAALTYGLRLPVDAAGLDFLGAVQKAGLIRGI